MDAANRVQLLDAGMTIGGRYRIAGVIGRGGMGVVYAAEDVRLQGKLRAVKASGRLGADYEQCAEEAKMLMRLSHPNVPQIVDYYPPDESGIEYVVMDFVQGETVADRLRRYKGRMPFEEIVSIGVQLCGALSYLHEQTPPIIHRDLKPSNVMIDANGHVRLIDFGIARFYKEGLAEDTLLLGTPGFAAPEQGGARQSDERTDIYGLGALLYYLASGGRAYDASDQQALDSSRLSVTVPQAFITAVSRMLQLNPALRYSAMRQAEEALAGMAPDNRSLNRLFGSRFASTRMQQLTVVLSAAPGAGATFVTMTLARLLAQSGTAVSAIEQPLQPPEWHAWLSGSRDGGKACAAADGAYYRLEQARLDWYAQCEDRPPRRADEEGAFRLLVEQAAIRKTLLDLSSGWHDRHSLHWMARASAIVVVADPNPVKWSALRLRMLHAELAKARSDGAQVLWVANKDVPFERRNEWLSLFPERPAASVPFIPHADWLELLYSGRWPTDRSDYRAALERSLQKVLSAIHGG